MERRKIQPSAIFASIVFFLLLVQCRHENVLPEKWLADWSSPSVNYLTLEKALVTENKTIQIGRNHYSSIIFPRGVVFPPSVSALIEQARNKGVTVVFADDLSETPTPNHLTRLVGNENKLAPCCPEIAFGKFTREGREIFILVNTGKENYHGEFEFAGREHYIVLDPRTGKVSAPQKISGEKIGVDLASLQTLIFTVL